MNRKQIYRAMKRLWERATEYDGYQPFGYDDRTLHLTKPAFCAAREWLRGLLEALPAEQRYQHQ